MTNKIDRKTFAPKNSLCVPKRLKYSCPGINAIAGANDWCDSNTKTSSPAMTPDSVAMSLPVVSPGTSFVTSR
jgi:hypothetical protein